MLHLNRDAEITGMSIMQKAVADRSLYVWQDAAIIRKKARMLCS